MFAIIGREVLKKQSRLDKMFRRFIIKTPFRCRIIKTGEKRILHIVCLQPENFTDREKDSQTTVLCDFLAAEGICCALCLPDYPYADRLAARGIHPPDIKNHFLSRIPEAARYALDHSGFDPLRTCGIVYADKMSDVVADTLMMMVEKVRYPVLFCRSGGELTCRYISENHGVPVLQSLGNGFDDYDRLVVCCEQPGRMLCPPKRAVVISAGCGDIRTEGDVTLADGARYSLPPRIRKLLPAETGENQAAAAMYQYSMLQKNDMPICALTQGGRMVL